MADRDLMGVEESKSGSYEAEKFEQIAQLIEELSENPYLVETHDTLIRCLKEQGADSIHELRNARLTKLESFAFTETELDDWLDDAKSIEAEAERIEQIKEFYEAVLPLYPYPRKWKEYLEFALEVSVAESNKHDSEEFFTQEYIGSLFKQALFDTMYDFSESHLVWDVYFNHRNDNSHDLDVLKAMYHERLAVPHNSLDTTFSNFSSFISVNYNSDYEEEMKKANHVYSKTKKFQNQIEYIELRLSEEFGNTQLWIQYLQSEDKKSKTNRNPAFIDTIFERSIRGRIGDENWIPVWLSYIYILYSQKSVQSNLEKILNKFTLFYPMSAIPWAEYVRNCEIFPSSWNKFIEARERILRTDLMHQNSYDDWKTLALAMLTYEFHYVQHGKLDAISELYTDCANFANFAINENNDVFHSVEKLTVQIFESLEDYDQARNILKQLTSRHKEQCENWLFFHEFERRHGTYETVSKVLRAAVSHSKVMDWPERTIHEWLTYEQLSGSLNSYKHALIQSNKELNIVNRRRITEIQTHQEIIEGDDEDYGNETEQEQSSRTSNKRSRHESDVNPINKKQQFKDTRDRENLTVKVSNLPSQFSESDLIKLFEDCGETKSATIFSIGDKLQGSLEFTNEIQVLAALTKDKKKIKDLEIKVERAVNSTVWVTNFPPNESQDAIKRLFDPIGKIVSVRFPSLRFNTNRRFCYIEFASSESSLLAVDRLNNKPLKGDDGKSYNLIVKISAPEEKKVRQNPVDEGREIFIRNLNFKKIDKTAITNIFQNYGTIDKIVLPLSYKNKVNENLNDGYAFVVFSNESEAKASLSANNMEVEGRNITVTISESKSKIKHHEKHYTLNANTTISVLEIADTISASQIQSFFSTVGPVKKVELHPEVNGALVEFEKVADAGKASIALNMKEFNGKPLKIGSISDLPKQNVFLEKPKMMIPTSVVRRNKKRI